MAGILGIAKFHLNTVEANTGFNLVAGAGLSASRIAKIAIETPEGDFEIASEWASQFEIFDRGFVKE